MVRVDTILESLVVASRQSDALPSAVTYSTIELDAEGDHSNVSPPIIEFKVDTLERDQSRNSERVGVTTDDDGNEEAYVYTVWFTAVIDVEVLTVTNTSITHRELENGLQKSLYPYDAHGLNKQPPDPTDPTEPLRDVSWIVYEGTERANNFGFNPTVRARNPTIEVGFTHEFLSTEFTEHEILESIDINPTASS